MPVTEHGHPLRFGVFITPSAADAGRVVDLAVLAERAGLDLVTFQDHPYQSRFLDTWTLLSFVAARTERVAISANVLNLPLRPPAVVARAVASLDILSGGRAELGPRRRRVLGRDRRHGRPAPGAGRERRRAGGGDRRHPGALGRRRRPRAPASTGDHYRPGRRGPGPGAGPRRRDLARRATSRGCSTWWAARPTAGCRACPTCSPATWPRATRASTGPRRAAGRDPADDPPPAERRPPTGRPRTWRALVALEDGIGTFILMADDAAAIERLAGEVAPAVRELVAAGRAPASARRRARARGRRTARRRPAAEGGDRVRAPRRARRRPTTGTPAERRGALGRVGPRPHRQPSGPEVTYTRRGRLVGQHLIDVHDMLRRELDELRGILEQVREGAMGAGEARAALNEMALRQNDWALGAFCARYCARRRPGTTRLEDDADLPPPAPQRAGPGPGHRPAGGGAPRHPRRHPGRGRAPSSTT